MEFSRQEYWSGLPLPSQGDLPHPDIEPKSPALAGRFFTAELPEKPNGVSVHYHFQCLPKFHLHIMIILITSTERCLDFSSVLLQI